MGHDLMARERTPGRGMLPAAFAFLFLVSGSAGAQTMYTCVANGRTYSGDRPPPECSNSDIRELNRDGSLRRVISRPLTAEEQKARALEAKKKAEEEERALAQRRRDRSLLEAYASEQEIDVARTKALTSSNAVVQRSQVRLDRMAEERKRLMEETEFYKNRETPETIKRALASNDQERAAELKIIKDAQSEMQRINDRFDADKKRFRELVSQGSQPAQRTY
jgi:Domain of unknown function (DUF4124)